MRRRLLLGRLGLGGVAAVLGGSIVQTRDVLAAPSATAASWASTERPEPVRGAVRIWWSADGSVGRRTAITFDDGPTPEFTPRVLDALAAANVRATFFVVGALADRHPDLVRRARDAGHEIANHSYDHRSAAVSGAPVVRSGVLRGCDTIERITRTRPRWYRAPRGELTTATLQAVREAGIELAMWSVDRGNAPDGDAEGVRRHLLTSLHPGAVVDLHDGIGRSGWVGEPDPQLITRRRAEITVLPRLLSAWRDAGWTFETLSDLIPPDDPTEIRDTPQPPVPHR
jgi:peptidoglycan/xylan/chitin deacetylase (PgdA/CDA1 family)